MPRAVVWILVVGGFIITLFLSVFAAVIYDRGVNLREVAVIVEAARPGTSYTGRLTGAENTASGWRAVLWVGRPGGIVEVTAYLKPGSRVPPSQVGCTARVRGTVSRQSQNEVILVDATITYLN